MIRSLVDIHSYESCITLLKIIGADFNTVNSNYCASICVDGYNQKYMQSFRGKRIFIAKRKLEDDLKSIPLLPIKEKSLKYYEHSINDNLFCEKAIQIDLRSAYATALFNDGFIRPSTYEYITTLEKIDRLVSIGMLASTNYTVDYSGGEIIGSKLIENKYKGFFYYAVKIVQDIMRCCRLEANNSYVFTWVDSVYIKYNPVVSNLIGLLLDANGFNCKKEIIYDLSTQILDDKIAIDYMKENGKVKRINIPHSKINNSAQEKRSFINKVKLIQ